MYSNKSMINHEKRRGSTPSSSTERPPESGFFYLAGCRKQEKRGDADSILLSGSSPRSLAERQQAVSFRYIKHEKKSKKREYYTRMPNALIRDRVDSIGGRQITNRQALDPQ